MPIYNHPKKTSSNSKSPICPKCDQENETGNHYFMSRSTFYQVIGSQYLGNQVNSLTNLISRNNITKLALYFLQTKRLAEYGQ